MTNFDYPATRAVLDGARGSGKRRTPAQWVAAIFEQQAAVLALTTENERLRCCGNCCWYSSNLGYCNDDVDGETDECNPSDSCHFEPARWSRRDTP